MQQLPQDLVLSILTFLRPYDLFTVRCCNQFFNKQVVYCILFYPSIFHACADNLSLQHFLRLIKQHQQELVSLNLSTYEQATVPLLNMPLLTTFAQLQSLHLNFNFVQEGEQLLAKIPKQFWNKLQHLSLLKLKTQDAQQGVYECILKHAMQLRVLKLQLYANVYDNNQPTANLFPPNGNKFDIYEQQLNLAPETITYIKQIHANRNQVPLQMSPHLHTFHFQFSHEDHGISDLMMLAKYKDELQELCVPNLNSFVIDMPRITFPRLTKLNCYWAGKHIVFGTSGKYETNVPPLALHKIAPNLQDLVLRLNSNSSLPQLDSLYELRNLTRIEFDCVNNVNLKAPELFQHCQNIEYLKLIHTRSCDLFDSLQEPIRLRKLILHNCTLQDSMMIGIYQSCTNVKSFTITDCRFTNDNQLSKLCANMKPSTVTIEECTNMDESLVSALLHPELKQIIINRCSFEKASGLWFYGKLPMVQTIECADPRANLENVIQFFKCTEMNNLTYLNISRHQSYLSDSQIAKLLKQAPHLQQFYATDCDIGTESIKSIPPSIKVLDLSASVSLDSIDLLSSMAMPNLETLIIGRALHWNDKSQKEQQLAKLVSTTPKLKSLVLHAIFCTSWVPVLQSLQNCPALLRLTITGATDAMKKNTKHHIPLAPLSELVSKCSALQSVIIDIPCVSQVAEWKKTKSKPKLILHVMGSDAVPNACLLS